MQLFGLVNALLVHDRLVTILPAILCRIITYIIAALIVNWYRNADELEQTATMSALNAMLWFHCHQQPGWSVGSPTATLCMHDLIREYRDSRKVILSVEHKLMQQVVSGNNGYDQLTHIQKLEVL